MDPVVERIGEIVSDLRMSDRAFELSINKSSGYLHSLRKKSSSPSVAVVIDIVNTHTDYNLNWILTGQGRMKMKTDALQDPGVDYSTALEMDFKIVNEKLDAIKKQNYEILHKLNESEPSGSKEK